MFDRRRKSDAEKLKTRQRHNLHRKHNVRKREWQAAKDAAARAGFSMNMVATVSWSLSNIDDAHGAELDLWRHLRVLAKGMGFPWLAMRAPEKGGRGGRHMHLFCHAPNDAARLAIIALIAEKTGAGLARLHLDGFRLKDCGRTIQGIMAKSRGGEWMVQRNMPELGDVDILTNYIAKAHGKARVDGQHRLSASLVALVKQSSVRSDKRQAAA
jgi:hypothetical protein